jgi:hypothetical protein
MSIISSPIAPYYNLNPLSRLEKALCYGEFLAYIGFNLLDSRRWFAPMSMLGLDLKGRWGWNGYWVGRILTMFVVDRLIAPGIAGLIDLIVMRLARGGFLG